MTATFVTTTVNWFSALLARMPTVKALGSDPTLWHNQPPRGGGGGVYDARACA